MFQVRWEESVLLELANLRAKSDDAARLALDAAIEKIIQRLATASATEGESRAGRQRILFEPPSSSHSRWKRTVAPPPC